MLPMQYLRNHRCKYNSDSEGGYYYYYYRFKKKNNKMYGQSKESQNGC
jgi:hypothetical protein